MADIVYSVEVAFLQKGGFAPAAGVDKAREATDKWKKSLLGGISSFSGAFNNAFDTLGGKVLDLGFDAAKGLAAAAGIGLAAATKAAFDFNDQMEHSTIALAAMANANGVADGIGNGMRLASDTLKDMRKDARELPGEFKDLANIMATISGATANAGMGMPGTEKLAAKTMAAAAVLSVPQNVAAREMAMMLEGNARHSMPMFTKLHMGIDTRDFNAMDPKKRLEAVTQALDKLNPSVDVFKNSWEGIKTTAVDNIRQGMGAVAGPLFASVKQQMQKFNNWAGDPDNKDELSRFGQKLGDYLDDAFASGIESVRHWYPIVSTFARHLYEQISGVWTRVGPIVQKALAGIEHFMLDPDAVEKMVNAAKTMAELRVAGGVLSTGASFASSEGGMAAAGALGVEGAVATGGALAILALAAEGATSAYLDQTSMFHGAATFLVGDIMGSLGQIGSDLKGIWSDLQPVREAMGIVLLGSIDLLVGSLEVLTSGAKELSGAFADVVTWVRKNITGPQLNPDTPEEIVRTQELFPIKKMDAFAHVEKAAANKVPKSVTHIHRVDINVNSNQDPNRIAKRTADVLTDIARHPKVATLTGAPVLSR